MLVDVHVVFGEGSVDLLGSQYSVLSTRISVETDVSKSSIDELYGEGWTSLAVVRRNPVGSGYVLLFDIYP